MPLFSTNLPEYTGPYAVGTIDIENPCDRRIISDINFKATGEPAFQVRDQALLNDFVMTFQT